MEGEQRFNKPSLLRGQYNRCAESCPLCDLLVQFWEAKRSQVGEPWPLVPKKCGPMGSKTGACRMALWESGPLLCPSMGKAPGGHVRSPARLLPHASCKGYSWARTSACRRSAHALGTPSVLCRFAIAEENEGTKRTMYYSPAGLSLSASPRLRTTLCTWCERISRVLPVWRIVCLFRLCPIRFGVQH